MSEPYMGQILFAGFNYAPRMYANCDGGTLTIAQYGALFTLLGITYGGNGSTNFLLPDLRGRTPFGAGVSLDVAWQPPTSFLGQIQGAENVALTQDTTPAHTHAINVSNSDGTASSIGGATFGVSGPTIYGQPNTATAVGLGGSPMTSVGSGQPHTNMQPFTVIEVAIALSGYFPVRP